MGLERHGAAPGNHAICRYRPRFPDRHRYSFMFPRVAVDAEKVVDSSEVRLRLSPKLIRVRCLGFRGTTVVGVSSRFPLLCNRASGLEPPISCVSGTVARTYSDLLYISYQSSTKLKRTRHIISYDGCNCSEELDRARRRLCSRMVIRVLPGGEA